MTAVDFRIPGTAPGTGSALGRHAEREQEPHVFPLVQALPCSRVPVLAVVAGQASQEEFVLVVWGTVGGGGEESLAPDGG